jgi:hypothetical protein
VCVCFAQIQSVIYWFYCLDLLFRALPNISASLSHVLDSEAVAFKLLDAAVANGICG